MIIEYASHSTAGVVRPNNEDAIGECLPVDDEQRRIRGSMIVLADGIGGQADGEIASELAVSVCLREFVEAGPGTTPNQVLWRAANAANLEIFEKGQHTRGGGRMGTTLTATIFRDNEMDVAHVGDCRAYVFRDGRILRITNDHSYAGVQLKLGLITVEEASASPNRSILTRSLGQDPFIRVDFHRMELKPGDLYLQCCDGIHAVLTEGEIYSIVASHPPKEACVALAEAAARRGSDDNLTAQVVRIDHVEKRTLQGGKPVFQKVSRSKMATDLEVGEVLDERFKLTDLIARSGMASIFKALDQQTQLTFAIKVPFMQFESDPGFYSRFEREEQIGRTLHHPYIIRIEPIDTPKSRPYIVMEFLQGQTLANLMRAVRPMPEHDAMRIAALVCEAMHYMHSHDIVHRDLKPDNIMICNDGSIRVMDFGIAKFEGMRRLTFGGFTPAMGTPDYMAPEQVKGNRGDKRTDIYSLGAILYEMVTGVTPFEAANPFLIMNARLTGDPAAPREKNPLVSEQAEEIILHAMSRAPADRYADAGDMRDELLHPKKVKVTGRAGRLVAVQPWKPRWTQFRVYALLVGIPVLIVGVVWLLSHLQWK